MMEKIERKVHGSPVVVVAVEDEQVPFCTVLAKQQL